MPLIQPTPSAAERPGFCFRCGSQLRHRYVEEEERERLVCIDCSHIHYINPHIVAGTTPTSAGRIWLLRRAIEPRYGYWTFPAGFMEMNESVEDAAVRETREELNLEARIIGLLGVYSRASWPNVLVVYTAEAASEPSAGRESLDFASFAPEEIPWSQIAFPSTRAALQDWVNWVRASGRRVE